MKQRLAFQVRDNNKLQTLLYGWKERTLDFQTVEMKSGFACARKYAVSDGMLHLRPFNISLRGELNLREAIHIPRNSHNNLTEYELNPGDVLFNNTNSIELVGKAAIVREKLQCAFSNHITRLRVRNKGELEPSWLLLCLRVLWLRGFFAENCNRWIGQAGFNNSKLAALKIPLPPVDVQRRIITRLEAWLADVQEGHNLLKQMHQDTEQVLSSALEEVFKKLVAERQSELLASHISHLTSGPRSWSKYANPSNNGSLFIRAGNVGFARLDFAEIQRLSLPPNIDEKRARVNSGDVLVTITGAKVGYCCVVPESLEKAYINQHVALVRLRERLEPRYLMWFILSPSGGFQQITAMQYGQTKPGLNLTNVRDISLPIPEKYEQRQIISYLDSIQFEVDKMRNLLEEDSKLLAHLEASILERAFRGEL